MSRLKEIQIPNLDGSSTIGYTFEENTNPHRKRLYTAATLWGGGIGANIAITSDNLATAITQTSNHIFPPALTDMLPPPAYINTFLDARLPYLCAGALLTFYGIHGSLLNPNTWKKINSRLKSNFGSETISNNNPPS